MDRAARTARRRTGRARRVPSTGSVSDGIPAALHRRRPGAGASARGVAARGHDAGFSAQGGKLCAAIAVALACTLVAPASAQELPRGRTGVEGATELATLCARGGADRTAPCRELVLAALAVQRGVGLASALGSDVPGETSTAGRRMGRVPRLGFALAAIGTGMGMPRVSARSIQGLAEEADPTVVGLRGVVSAGLLDGFQLAPGIGGILSADVTASYSRLWLPEEEGFGAASSGIGLGARVGVLRESFTTPGLSVSIARRWHETVRVGDVGQGNPGEMETDVQVTSLRAMLGKNWFVVGLMAGAGWDRYVGKTAVSAMEGVDGPGAATGRLASERTVYFASAWYSFLISRLSLEAGVADGVSDPFDDRSGEHDPAGRSWFASLAVRITP